MSREAVSPRQFLTILFVCLFPLATERIPEHLSGADGWLSPLLAGAAAVALMGWISKHLDQKGEIPLWASLPLMAWGVFLAAAHTARLGSRLSEALRASPTVVMAGVLLLSAWVAAEGVQRFGRSCEIFIMAIGTAFVLILCFGLPGVDWNWFSMEESADPVRVSAGAVSGIGTLCAGSYALALTKEVGPVRRRDAEQFLLLLFLALTGAVILILGRFGPALTGMVDRPFFQMVSGLGLPGAFQRVEALISALWMVGDVSLLALLLLSLSRLAKKWDRPLTRWGFTLVTLAVAVVFPHWDWILRGEILPFGNLAAAALFVLGKRKRKKSKNLEKSA